jgi:hypothetical protein
MLLLEIMISENLFFQTQTPNLSSLIVLTSTVVSLFFKWSFLIVFQGKCTLTCSEHYLPIISYLTASTKHEFSLIK